MSEKNKTIKKFREIFLKDWPIKIICIVFAFIVFLFYRRSTLGRRYFSANLKIESTNKLVAASGYPHSVKLILWGDALSIASIKEEDLEVYLDLSSYTEPGTYKVPVKTRISGTALNVNPLDISVEPRSVDMRLEESASKIVPVYLSLTGTSAGSFEVSKTIVKPSKVEVYGPKSLISKIDTISTEAIVIENRNSNFSGRAHLVNKNSLVSIVGAGAVEYWVEISERIINRDLKNVPVQVQNLNQNLLVDSRIHSVLLTVSGKEAILDAFVPTEDFASIDLSGITEPGEYTVKVIIKKIDGVEVKTVFPDSLAISIVPNEEASESSAEKDRSSK